MLVPPVVVDIIIVPILGTAGRFMSCPFLFSFPSSGPLTLCLSCGPEAAILSCKFDFSRVSVPENQHSKLEHNSTQLQVCSLTPNGIPSYLRMTELSKIWSRRSPSRTLHQKQSIRSWYFFCYRMLGIKRLRIKWSL